ncbi:hypothetical protein [Halioxenophilus sp. WMMB6]|uniref:hypothetical protein n=1 Tax=Halioxenophilus sp. WMMB6 TaxID=3073815 RepID=UPI00295E98B0|nr:hypothetical protein [Halioxenophilus sp. WMMB6]
MNKDFAEKLLGELLQCHEALGRVEVSARSIEDKDLQRAMRKAIMFSASYLYTEAMGRIISRYPELEPFPLNGVQPKSE